MYMAALAAIIFVTYYGTYVVFLQRFVQESMHPLWLNTLSYLVVSGFVLLSLPLSKHPSPRLPSLPGLSWSAVAAFAAAVIGDLSALIGLQLSSALNWTLLLLLAPIATYLLSITFLKKTASLLRVISLVMGVVGALFVIYNPQTQLVISPGDLLFLLGVLGYSISNITTELASSHISPSTITKTRIITAALFLTCINIFWRVDHTIHWNMVLANAFSVILGTSLITFIIKTAGASFFALSNNLIPFVTVLASFFILRELPSSWQIFGGIIIIFSLTIFALARPSSRSS